MVKREPLVGLKRQGAALAAGIVATAMLLGTLAIVIAAIHVWPDKKYMVDIAYLVVFWAIAPPLWFFFEFYYLWNRKSDFEWLKHGQAVAGAIWLAILGILVGYLNAALK